MFPAPQTKVEEDEGAEKQEREQRRTGRQVVHAHAQKSWIFLAALYCWASWRRARPSHPTSCRRTWPTHAASWRACSTSLASWRRACTHKSGKLASYSRTSGRNALFGDTCLPGVDKWSFFFTDTPEVEQPLDVRLDLDEEEDEVEEGYVTDVRQSRCD